MRGLMRPVTVSEERLTELRKAATVASNIDLHSLGRIQFTNEELVEIITRLQTAEAQLFEPELEEEW